MSRINEAIASVAYILDCLMAYRNVVSTGNCNNCKNKDCGCKPKPGHLVRYNCPHYKGKGMINAEPPADVVEVKHGYWFVDERPESDREVTCSVCEKPVFRYHDHIDWRPLYCPHCGAKMDDERKEKTDG